MDRASQRGAGAAVGMGSLDMPNLLIADASVLPTADWVSPGTVQALRYSDRILALRV